jgi:hypothetical protein
MKQVYPEGYNDADKAAYDDLITRGRQLLGSKINTKDEFLLDLSAKITINQWRGYDNNLSRDEIDNMKKMHKDMMNAGEIKTLPSDEFYDKLSINEVDDETNEEVKIE